MFATTVARFFSQFSSAIVIFGLIFMSGQKKRSFFWLRLLVLFPYGILFSATFGKIFGITEFQDALKAFFLFGPFDFSWVVIFVLCIAMWYFWYDIKFVNLIFLSSVAYCAQNVTAYIGRAVSYCYPDYFDERALYWRFAIHIVCYLAAYFLATPMLTKKVNERPNSKITILFFIVTISLISLFSGMIYNTGKETQITCIYSVVVAALLFAIQIGMFDYQIKVKEKSYIERMFYEQSRQREQYNDNINRLNVKYHDLKHYVALMKAGQNVDDIKEIEDILSVHEAHYDTGNAVLDTLLAEKKLYADKAGIAMNVVGRAEVLSFMQTADVYALFGNALDNAFEAVEKYNKDKRLVRVEFGADKKFFRIIVENYFEGSIGETNADGSPVTTKDDKDLHGFGIKSMKYIAEKYKGNICIDTTSDLFILLFLFPLSLQKETKQS